MGVEGAVKAEGEGEWTEGGWIAEDRINRWFVFLACFRWGQ